MADPRLATTLARILSAAGSQAAGGPSDAELLARFCDRRDQASFAALVDRHGPMVLRVCRRVLGHAQDSEDCFQATFLVLARSAGSLRARESLASWLHGVARRLALQAIREAARRRAHERRAPPGREAARPAEVAGLQELQDILDAEVARLPERYRAPFVLCCLEGRGRAEAAAELGWKEGTVASRVARARTELTRRLARRGVRLTAALCAAAISREAAAVPARLAKAAALVAVGAGPGRVPINVAALAASLTGGGLREMIRTKTTAHLALALVACAGVTWAALALGQPPAADPPAGKDRAAAGAPALKGPERDRPPAADLRGDPLPPGAVTRLGTIRFRHSGLGVHAAAYAPDGKLLAGAGGDFVHVWESDTGRERLRLTVPAGNLQCVAYGPGGAVIAAGGKDGTVRLWDAATGKELREIGAHPGVGEKEPRGGVVWVAVAPDGKRVYSAGLRVAVTPDGRRVYSAGVAASDAATGERVRAFDAAPGVPRGFALSADGKLLAGSCWEAGTTGRVRLWDAATGKVLRDLEHPGDLTCVAFSPDGKTVAAGVAGKDGSEVQVWDAATGKAGLLLRGHRGQVSAVAFSPDGKRVISGGHEANARVWDAATGKELRQVGEGRMSAAQFVLSPDGGTLVTRDGQTVRFWNVETGKEDTRPEEGSRHPVQAVAFSPDGKSVATAVHDFSGEAGGRVWDATAGKELRRFGDPGHWISAAVWTPDGKALVSAGADGTFHVWNAGTGKELRRFMALAARVMTLAPDGKTLACSCRDESVGLWDVTTGKEIGRLSVPGRQVSSLAFSPDGKTLAAGIDGWTVPGGSAGFCLWEVASRKLAGGVEQDPVFDLDFSPDGKALVTAGTVRDRTAPPGRQNVGVVKVWEVATLGERAALRPGTFVTHVAFSPDGRRVAYVNGGTVGEPADRAKERGVVRLWEPATGKELRPFGAHPGGATGLAFSPDGRLLATGGFDTTALIWAVPAITTGGGPPGEKPTAAELDGLWAKLGSGEAPTAYDAIRRLAAAPGQAVPLLKDRLAARAAADPDKLGRLVADLGDAAFATRERATRELEALGPTAEGVLRKGLEGEPSPERRQRVERLLARLDRERPRSGRAVEVLELAGTREARDLLDQLAKGADGPLAQDAKAALGRVDRFPAGRNP